jgi:hypothetical protein
MDPSRILFALVTMLALSSRGPQTPAAGLDPSAWRGDVRFLVAAVDSIHPRPYRRHSRAELDSAAADLERRLPSLRYDQAVGEISRLLALLGDGHSRLDQLRLPSHGEPTLGTLPGPGFDVWYPVKCEVFADGLWIVKATRLHSDLLGSKVVAINGRPVAEAVAKLEPLIPADNPMWTLRVLPALLRSPGYLAASGVAEYPETPLRLTVVNAVGRQRQVLITAEPSDTATSWIDADAGVAAPLPLTRRLAGPFSYEDFGDDQQTVFVRIREIVNEPGQESMAAFVARLFAHVDSIGSNQLIIDLRGNGGGNNYLNQPLVHALIQHPELDKTGRLFVVVDRGTFSAAVSLAADLQRETHALFVGEPTGAGPNSPGDPVDVRLPVSGLVARVSTVYWQGSDPRDPREFIAPDLPATPTWADWLAHRDPALGAINAYRPSQTEPDVPPNTRWGSRAQLKAQVPKIAW